MGRDVDGTVARSELNKNEKPILYVTHCLLQKKLLFPFFMF